MKNSLSLFCYFLIIFFISNNGWSEPRIFYESDISPIIEKASLDIEDKLKRGIPENLSIEERFKLGVYFRDKALEKQERQPRLQILDLVRTRTSDAQKAFMYFNMIIYESEGALDGKPNTNFYKQAQKLILDVEFLLNPTEKGAVFALMSKTLEGKSFFKLDGEEKIKNLEEKPTAGSQHAKTKYNLGKYYYNTRESSSTSLAKAIKNFREVAEKEYSNSYNPVRDPYIPGPPPEQNTELLEKRLSQFMLAIIDKSEIALDQKIEYLKIGAFKGVVLAQYLLGVHYLSGVDNSDEARAYQWLKIASKNTFYPANDRLKLLEQNMNPETISKLKNVTEEFMKEHPELNRRYMYELAFKDSFKIQQKHRQSIFSKMNNSIKNILKSIKVR